MRALSRPVLASAAAGVAVTALGVLLLLQENGSVDLAGGWLGAALAACAGAALVASGLAAREP